MDKKDIKILFSCDTNYVMPLTVCITSILENNKENKIDIYILFSALTDNQKNILNNLAKKYGQIINLLQVNEKYFDTAPTLRWSKETYYRLLVNEFLPKDIGKIIYLDCDTIVNKSLDDLYEINMNEKYLAAREEVSNDDIKKRLGLGSTTAYFQAGVILFNLNKCRELLNYEMVEKKIKELGEKITTADQDVINVIFEGKILPIDKKFNNSEITSFQGLNICNRDEMTKDTCIFHYANSKPWNNLYSGSCEDIWYKYLQLSPYKDLYNKKYNSLKYKILRSRIVKKVFYSYIKITPHINNLAKKFFPAKLYSKLKRYYRKNIK